MRQVILNFHGIGSPKRPLETGEADYWISEDFFTEVIRIAHRFRDEVRTSFTFDDGNLSDLVVGAEGLARLGLSATFFILSGRLDELGSLASDDLRTLKSMGHEIGSHGACHQDWTRLDKAALETELVTSRQLISDAIGVPVETAAIPFGRYDGRVLKALRANGYKRAFSSDGGEWREGQFPIPRNSLRSSFGVAEVDALLSGRETFKARFRRELVGAVKRRM